jgi:hypothetical protein
VPVCEWGTNQRRAYSDCQVPGLVLSSYQLWSQTSVHVISAYKRREKIYEMEIGS